ncbi:MAG: MFS transporter [Verrucomicrobiota bacterium]|nr:MFS transporter [Verrucomicrobiota bacterium]
MRWFAHQDIRSLHFLNATQFLGAMNDNVFKFLVIYLLINVQGDAASAKILSLAGAIYVIPFLLFSSAAGVLADRISKTKIIVLTRVFELVAMLFGLFAISLAWPFGCYFALFLMAMQSAIFGPSKYGIIPELVEHKMISRANSSITSMTYLAIILGTFFAAFLTDITNKNFGLASSFCVLIAAAGLATSLGIKRTEAGRSETKINPLFFYEIYKTVRFSLSTPHLVIAMFGSSFFLFLGSFLQLNIIPFGMQALHLSEVGGGYLFLAAAIGIALGARFAGRISKERVEPGLSAATGLCLALLLFLLAASSSLTIVIITLILLGISGGCFLIPFDSFIQTASSNHMRGQAIAAANFFSFFGVLLAAFAIYLFSDEWGFSAASGFGLMGAITLVVSLFLMGNLSVFFLPFLVNRILHKWQSLRISTPLPEGSSLLLFEGSSWWPCLLLFGFIPKLHLLFLNHYLARFPWFNGWISSFSILPSDPGVIQERIHKLLSRGERPLLFFCKDKDDPELLATFATLSLPIYKVKCSEEENKGNFLFFRKREFLITVSPQQ